MRAFFESFPHGYVQVERAGLLKGGSEVSECVEGVLKAPEGHLKMSKAWLAQIDLPAQAPPITA